MASRELQVINSVCETKDISVLMAQNVDPLFDVYKDVWDDVKKYYAKYRTVPSIAVLRENHPDLEEVETEGDTAYYVENLREEYVKAKLHAMTKGVNSVLDDYASAEILNKLSRDIIELTKMSAATHDVDVMDFDAAEEHYAEIRKKAEEMGGTPGIPTGISFIDSAYTSGLAGGDLIIALGWTGRGKSLFSTLIACNAFDHGRKVMIISLEMSPAKVRDRVYTMMGTGLFRNSDLAMGDIDEDNFRSWSAKYRDRKGFVVIEPEGGGELTPNMVQAKVDQHKPDLVIIDYAQLASDNGNSKDMNQRMLNMSKEYKRLAMANDIPVILISSATADSTSAINTPPIIEQVAWSRQLAYDADLAFAVHKHNELDDGSGIAIIEIVGRKNRNGELFAGYLKWDINNGKVEEDFGDDILG